MEPLDLSSILYQVDRTLSLSMELNEADRIGSEQGLIGLELSGAIQRSPSTLIQDWNNTVESFLTNPNKSNVDRVRICQIHSIPMIKVVSQKVQDYLVDAIHRLSKDIGCTTDLHQDRYYQNFFNSIYESRPIPNNLEALYDASLLLRTGKNLIRFYRYLRATNRLDKESWSAGQKSPIQNLQSHRMMDHYLALFCLSTQSENVASTGEYQDDISAFAKHSATAVFHASFALDQTDIDSKQALAYLVDYNTISGLHIFLDYLHRAATSPTIHSSILFPVMKTLQTIIVTVPKVHKVINDIIHETNSLGFYQLLVYTLRSCLLSTPLLSPQQHLKCQDRKVSSILSSLPDYRWELIIETLRVLFAFDCVRDKSCQDSPTAEIRRLLQDIVVDILLLPRNIKEQECKVASLSLYMDPSNHLMDTLVKEDAIPELLYILKFQLDDAFLQAHASGKPVRYDSNVTGLLPILTALVTLSKENPTIQNQVRNEVFSQDQQEFYLDELKHHFGRDVITDGVSGKILVAKNVQPIYAPPGTILWQLIQLMTSVQSNVKRYTNELLWILCQSDKVEFILRTGFGNAVQFLGSKGLVNISEIKL